MVSREEPKNGELLYDEKDNISRNHMVLSIISEKHENPDVLSKSTITPLNRTLIFVHIMTQIYCLNFDNNIFVTFDVANIRLLVNCLM